MKILAHPIDIIAVFKEAGRHPIPYRFKYTDTDGDICDVVIGKIISVDEKRMAGARTYNYLCQSEINGVERQYVLKYNIQECKWQLYKI